MIEFLWVFVSVLEAFIIISAALFLALVVAEIARRRIGDD
jgi:hypothetical protein